MAVRKCCSFCDGECCRPDRIFFNVSLISDDVNARKAQMLVVSATVCLIKERYSQCASRARAVRDPDR